jgi:uncharacterized protein
VYEYGCKLFRKRIECAIMMKAAEADLGLADEDVFEIREGCGDCDDCE